MARLIRDLEAPTVPTTVVHATIEFQGDVSLEVARDRLAFVDWGRLELRQVWARIVSVDAVEEGDDA
jgi:hypothetical protein